MARRPFFGQNDTKIAKMDMQAATAPGRAYASAFQKLGDIASDTLEKFREKKEEKEQQELSKNQIVNLYKGNPDHPVFKALDVQSIDEAKAVAGDFSKQPELLTQAMSFAKAVTDEKQAQEASALRDLQRQQILRNMERQKDADLLADEERMSENQFMQSLMSQTASPQAQSQADIARPGLAALGNGDARNRFMQAQLQQPQNQVPVSSLGSQDFGRFASREGLDPKLSVARMEALRQAEQKPQKIARTITVQDGQGGFTQVGVDEAGNPVRDFGPPKPSGMYPTPEEQAKGKEDILSVENANDFVNKTRENSLDSAKSIRPATRALTLLEKGDLDTGGIAELKTNTIAMLDSLGIPIDKETMDKVANTQNFRAEVGKFLFENISNTKGSISEKEMDIFAKISPGLQMTPEANKVLLKYVIKKAERDKDRVKFIQDMRRKGVGIVEQRNRLEDYMIENDLSEVLSPIAGQPVEQSPQNTFNLNGQSVQGEVVGTKPNGDKLIKVNGQIFVQPAQ